MFPRSRLVHAGPLKGQRAHSSCWRSGTRPQPRRQASNPFAERLLELHDVWRDASGGRGVEDVDKRDACTMSLQELLRIGVDVEAISKQDGGPERARAGAEPFCPETG